MSESACGHGAMISLDQALALYEQELRPLPLQTGTPDALHGQVLAQAVHARVDLPMFRQSAVDGYALHAADVAAASAAAPVRLPLLGEVRAGFVADAPLPRGQALRIFTGGQLPLGADTVARQEIVVRDGAFMSLSAPLAPGTDIRERGEELRAGVQLAQPGQLLHAGLIAALAMAGVRQLQAYRRPRIAVLVTGDEVSVEAQGEAEVFDANGPLLRSWLVERGYPPPATQQVPDQRERLHAAMAAALEQSDLLLTTGGVSVGDYDLVRPVASELGVREVFWQVAQKPGKPLYFGIRERGGAQQIILGLPGNPGAVLIGLHVHVAAVLARLQGAPPPQWQQGRLAARVRSDDREQLLRMQRRIDADGQVWLDALPRQASHMLSNLTSATALVRIAAGHAPDAGSCVPWLPLP